MREPRAQTLEPEARATEARPARQPRAFTRDEIETVPHEVEARLETLTDGNLPDLPELAPQKAYRRMGWLARTGLAAAGILISLALGLWVDQLLRDLFDRFPALGWIGLAAAALAGIAVLALALRELLALRRLRVLDGLRRAASEAIETDNPDRGRAVLSELSGLYHARPDLANARNVLAENTQDLFDGSAIVHHAERVLMSPLDGRARALTATAARRVAVVTAISPRALVDIGFVVYESFRLAGAISRLYGARPGFLGSIGLTRAILSHLAVTGGVALGDSVAQQLVGHGLAARLSARLGEGLVNGLMTVRVGIAAMRVVRPLPFDALKAPTVADFIPELAKVAGVGKSEAGV